MSLIFCTWLVASYASISFLSEFPLIPMISVDALFPLLHYSLVVAYGL